VTDSAEGGLSALSDLRVVELGVWVAAPAAGALLADWGADVIKVEPPRGDPMRHAFGSIGVGKDLPHPAFALDNRGKRSVVLDLHEVEDRARLEDLLATADVFLTNLRPDALDGLDLQPDETVGRHPRLVYCSVSGYGLRGDDRARPAYDIGAFWARSGLSTQLAGGDGVPLNPRGGIGDHISGLAALAGLLAAVLEQRQSGKGQVVEVSLLRTGTYVLGWDLSIQAALGKVAGSEPRHAVQTPLMNSYRTSDGRWFFFTGLEADRHIGSVCRALGRPDLLSDPRFADARSLRRHRSEVIAILDEIVAHEPMAVWAERFDREGVWWAPAQGPAEVLADPQLAANHGFLEIGESGTETALQAVNGPVTFSGFSSERAAPAPGLGEHTEEVLAELKTEPRPGPGPGRGDRGR
jgi:crotonobetainyl-CoA:carnitine CoA-transferase CaiB-like acyl-CoA transferase